MWSPSFLLSCLTLCPGLAHLLLQKAPSGFPHSPAASLGADVRESLPESVGLTSQGHHFLNPFCRILLARRASLDIKSEGASSEFIVVGTVYCQVLSGLQTGQPATGSAVRPSPPASGCIAKVSASSHLNTPEHT